MCNKNFEPLMTKKEVAEYLHVSTKAIERWVQQGKLKQCKVPGDMRFNPEYIHGLALSELENNEYTPFRCRKLEHENKELKERINYYKQILAQIDILTSKVRYENLKEK